MSGTDEASGPTGGDGAATGNGELSDHEYFLAVEEVFVGLRGAPLLLSPKDWQTAREWHREGIPLGLVLRTLEDVFERRRERGDEDRISSLRYCSRAVRAAWKEVRELTEVASRPGGSRAEEGAPSAPGLEERLEALAHALPEELPGRAATAERVRALAGPGPRGAQRDERRVEEALTALDAEVLEGLIESLDPARREELEGEAARRLEPMTERLPREELGRARRRLVAQKVRRLYDLPTLSLFAPEAEPGAAAESEGGVNGEG